MTRDTTHPSLRHRLAVVVLTLAVVVAPVVGSLAGTASATAPDAGVDAPDPVSTDGTDAGAAGHDHPGHDHPGHDHPGHDHSNHDHSGDAAGSLPAAPAGFVLDGDGTAVHRDTERPSTFAVETAVAPAPAVDHETTVTVTVTPERTARDVAVSLPDYPLFDGAPAERDLGTLAAGETATVEFALTPRAPLARDVFVRVNATVDGATYRQTESVRVDATGGRGNESVTRLPAALADRYGSDGDEGTAGTGDAVEPASSHVTVTGQFLYSDPGGGFSPARQVQVELWEADKVFDDRITTRRTDDQGRISFTVSYDDVQEPKDPSELYLKIEPVNPAAEVTAGGRGDYHVVTGQRNVRAGDTADFGSFAPSSISPAFQAADWALSARRYVRDNTGVGRTGIDRYDDPFTRKRVRMEWPESDWPSYNYRYKPNGKLRGNSEHVQLPDRSDWNWGRSTLNHEYAHAVHTAAYHYDVDRMPNKNDYSSCHTLYSETDPGFAFIEGFAEFFEVAMSNSTGTLSASGQDAETNHWYDTNSATNCTAGDTRSPLTSPTAPRYDGNRVEGSAASILYDLVDVGNANDESLEYSFELVFYEVLSHETQSMVDYWNDWNQGDRSELTRTYFRYGIVRNDVYDLDATLENPDRNDDHTTAARLYGNPLDLMLVGGESDYFYLPLERGEEFNASVDYNGSLGTLDVTIYEPGGTTVAAGSGTANSTGTVTATQDGRYYVAVTGVTPSDVTAPYTLRYGWERALPADRFEENDDLGSAARLPDSFSSNGLTVVAGDTDYYRVHAESDEVIDADLSFAQAESNLDLTLYDGNYARVASSNSATDDESLSHAVSGAGTYYLAVSPCTGTGCTETGLNAEYDLDVEVRPGNDDYEPNDVRYDAAQVPVSTLEAAVVDGEDDWYEVSLVAGETLSASVTPDDSTEELWVYLYDSNGNRVDRSGVNGDAQHTASAPGSYYAKVLDRVGFSTNARYGLDLSSDVDPSEAGAYNNDFASATPVSPGRYDGIELTEGDPVDYYAVDVTEGEALEASLTFDKPPSLNGEEVVLYDPQRTLVNRTYIGSGSGRNASADLVAQQTGTYYVKINDSEYPPFEYNLSVTTRPDDAYEDNDAFADAARIGSGTFELEMFADSRDNGGAGERDLYAVGVRRNETLSVSMAFPRNRSLADVRFLNGYTEDRTDLGLVVYDPNQRMLVENDSITRNTESVNVTANVTGVHYVEVTTPDPDPAFGRVPGDNDATPYTLRLSGATPPPKDGPYTLGALERFRDSVSLVDRLERGRTDRARLAPDPEEVARHLYLNDVGTDERFRVELGALREADAVDGDGSPGPVTLTLYSPEGVALDAVENATAGDAVSVTTPYGGQYGVAVSREGGDGGVSYALSVESGAPADDRLAAGPFSDALPRISPGTHDDLRLVADSPSVAEDVDTFRVPLVEGERLTLDATPADPGREGTLEVEVAPVEGSAVEVLERPGPGTVTVRATSGGPHRVVVRGPVPEGGAVTYALSVAADPPADDEYEPNDALAEPVPLGPAYDPVVLEGLRLTRHDRDAFGVALEAGDALEVAVSAATEAGDVRGAEVAVYDPEGRVVAAAGGEEDGPARVPSRSLTARANATGTYTVAVDAPAAPSTDYRLRLAATRPVEPDRFEANDNPEAATTLAPDGFTGDLTLTGGDVDAYRVELAAGRAWSVGVTEQRVTPGATGARTLRVLGPDGEPLATAGGGAVGDATGPSTTVTAATAGEYTLVVRGDGNASASYGLSGRVAEAEGPPPLDDGLAAPTNVDDDAALEDVNGNGNLTLSDVTALFTHRDSASVTDYPTYFDYNGNGDFTLADVTALFVEAAS
jgi:hypothetical protein